MEPFQINLRAFSKDGYLIDQRLLKNIPYGMKQSNYNGCGWIAAYNFLHGCGRKKEWNAVRQQMEDSLFLGGLLGTHVVHLYWYLRRHGFHLHWAVGRKAAQTKAARCKAGILFYFNGAALHFVTFLPATAEEVQQFADAAAQEMPDGQPQYRFFNGRMGKQRDYATMEAFLQAESKAPVLLQLTTR